MTPTEAKAEQQLAENEVRQMLGTDKIPVTDYRKLCSKYYALESSLFEMRAIAKLAIAELPESDLKKQLKDEFDKLKGI